MATPDHASGPGGAGQYRLTDDERRRLDVEGFCVRERAIAGAELEDVRSACETMVERLRAIDPGTPKIPAGSYCFQLYREPCTIVKWEPDHPDVVQGVEPFAHFDERLHDWGLDPRFVEPMRGLLDADEIELFTEKLNVKRARVGGPIVLHQDYPYWVENSDDPGQIATAVLFLDDADTHNGCLEVLPGSHRDGVRGGGSSAGFGRFEMDPEAVPEDALVALEVPAGTLVCFGSLLVHRSLPNRSGGDRRTLLYSYQPAGRQKSIDSLSAMLGKRR